MSSTAAAKAAKPKPSACRWSRKSSARRSAASAARWRGVWPVAGCDEAGRGPLAGPVVAAAVILDPERIPRGLNNSKKLDREEREKLYAKICATAEVAVAFGSTERIDRDNILRASLWALARAVRALPVRPKLVFVDGRDRIDCGCDCEAVISGDALVTSIAAASIVAKVTRDRLMRRLGVAHPGYGFERHMGYSVPEHFHALNRLGPTIHHRRSFAPVAAFYGETVVEVAVTATGCRSNRNPPSSLRISRPGLPAARSVYSNGGLAAPVSPQRRGLRRNASMSLFVELLRTRPRMLFWRWRCCRRCCGRWCRRCFIRRRPASCRWCWRSATNSSSAPSSGRRWRSGSPRSPTASAGMTGVYLLSQICIVVDLLGGVRARPRHRRRAACGDGGDADGRHRGVLGADAGIRAGHPRDAAVGADAAALLDGARAGRAGSTGSCSASRPGLLLLTTYAGLILLGAARWSSCWRPSSAARQLETVGPWLAGVVDDRGAVSVSDLARPQHRHRRLLDLATIVRQSAHLGLARAGAAAEPCRHGDPDRARPRLP